MRKHTITFELPEDQPELDLVQMAPGMHAALNEFSMFLRNGVKYEGKPWEDIRKEFYDILNTYKVDLD